MKETANMCTFVQHDGIFFTNVEKSHVLSLRYLGVC